MTVAHPAPPVEAADFDAALAAVRAAGLRVTAPRRLLLESLWEASEALTAERLNELAGGGGDVASVYRNLETFERAGLVRHFHLGHGPGLYARISLGPREYLVCDACGEHYGRARYACGEHRGELKAQVREHYGCIGPHPWKMGPHKVEVLRRGRVTARKRVGPGWSSRPRWGPTI